MAVLNAAAAHSEAVMASAGPAAPVGSPTALKRLEQSVKAKAALASFKRPSWWVLIFGWTLALCAGLVNTVAFRSWGVFVSHATGATAAIGIRVVEVHHAEANLEQLCQAVGTVLSFLLGAFACGLLVDKNHVHFGGKAFYGVALVGNAVLLVVAVALSDPTWASCFAAAACGLQNAMCTSHFGAVVRTTHVTGTLTDIGSTLGRMAMIYLRKGCRRSQLDVLEQAEVSVDAKKLVVLLPMWLSFLFGAIFGAYLWCTFQVRAMLFPAGVTFFLGLGYMHCRSCLKERLKRWEAERLSNDLGELQRSLSRTHENLQNAMNMTGPASATEHVMEMDIEVGQILETIHAVEESVERSYH